MWLTNPIAQSTLANSVYDSQGKTHQKDEKQRRQRVLLSRETVRISPDNYRRLCIGC